MAKAIFASEIRKKICVSAMFRIFDICLYNIHAIH